MGSFEAWIGTRYDEARDGKPRQLLEGRTDLSAHVREKVLFPADRLPDALQEDGDARRGVLLLGVPTQAADDVQWPYPHSDSAAI